jgi:RNA polymerase sigma-70 factor (ECF subfamily)
MVDERRKEPIVPTVAARSETSGVSQEMERVFRDHAAGVLRAAYRVTGNLQDAEDVVQTVFLRIVRRDGTAPLGASSASYLHRAAINAALDVVRARRSARATPLEAVEPTLVDASRPGPDEVRGARELEDRVRDALAQVSPKAAEIFVLRYFEGYDNHEIARMVGTSRGTVGVTLHRTRQRVREELERPGGDES